jgi:hypothetical protein
MNRILVTFPQKLKIRCHKFAKLIKCISKKIHKLNNLFAAYTWLLRSNMKCTVYFCFIHQKYMYIQCHIFAACTQLLKYEIQIEHYF